MKKILFLTLSLLIISSVSAVELKKYKWNDIRTFNTLEAAAAVGYEITSFNEDPKFTAMVKAGKLPPVKLRLPKIPKLLLHILTLGSTVGRSLLVGIVAVTMQMDNFFLATKLLNVLILILFQ